MSASFRRLAKVQASTRRPPALNSDGKRGEPTVQIASLSCTPLDPAEDQKARDLAFRLTQALDAPIELIETFVDASLDIKESDLLIVSGREYAIRGVDEWTWRGGRYLRLLVEATKP